MPLSDSAESSSVLDVGEERFRMGHSDSPKIPIIVEKSLKGLSAIYFNRQALDVSELCTYNCFTVRRQRFMGSCLRCTGPSISFGLR